MERIDVTEYPVTDPTTPGAVGTVLEDAKETVGTVLEDAKEQARSVAETAVEQTKGVFAGIGSDLSAEAHTQKLRMAKGLEDFSTELDDVALNGTGRVPSLAGEAAERTRTLSRWVENTEASDMLRSVEDFGRRRPAVFLLGSVLAGIAAGRLTRGMIDDRSDSTDTATPNTVVYPTVTPVTPVPVNTYGSLS